MIYGEDVQTTAVTCKMHFKVCRNRKVNGAWDKEKGDGFKQLTSQFLNAQTPSQYLRLLFVQRSYPEIFFQLLETVTYYLLKPNSKFKKISPSKIFFNF